MKHIIGFSPCDVETYMNIILYFQRKGWKIGPNATEYKANRCLVLRPEEKRIGYTDMITALKKDYHAVYIKVK